MGSQSWACPTCGPTCGLLAPPGEEQNPEQDKEVKDIVEGLQMKGEEKESKSTNPTEEGLHVPSTPAAVTLPISSSPTCPASAATSVSPASTVAPPDAAALAPAIASSPASASAPAASVTLPAPAAPAPSAGSVPRPRRARATQARPNEQSVGVQVY